MTNEQALEIIKQPGRIGCNLIKANDEESNKYNQESIEALDMAIKALEQQACNDCVSREQVLKELKESAEHHANDSREEVLLRRDRDIIRALPPVTPTRKVGKWIYDKKSQNWRCSVCNETPKTLGYVGTADFMEKEFVFCNHCGAEMKGAENG